jgi:hypothetical protein
MVTSGYCKRVGRERGRRRAPGREREKRGRPGEVGLLQGLLVGQGSRRWQAGGGIGLPGASHAAAPCLSEEDKGSFQKAPWTLGSFLVKLKTALVYIVCRFKFVQEMLKVFRGCHANYYRF